MSEMALERSPLLDSRVSWRELFFFPLVLAVIKACGFLKIQVLQESKKINLSPSFYFPKGKKLEVFVCPLSNMYIRNFLTHTIHCSLISITKYIGTCQ